MKKLVFTALITVTAIMAEAQTSETRKSENFTTLDVKNGIEVVFTQSDSPSLKVESDSNDHLNKIVTEYKRGTLKIYMREPESGENNKTIHGVAKVYVSQNNVTSFKAATGSSIKVVNKLIMKEVSIKLATGATFTGIVECSDACSIKADSGSSFRGSIATSSFNGNITGGASIKITGNADDTMVYCNNGSFQAGKFISGRADVKTINASTAFVNASKSIKANTDDSSTITYFGDPADVNLGSNSYAVKRDNLKLALN